MDELLKHIEELQKRVADTIALLKLDEKKKEAEKLEGIMSNPGYWEDTMNAQKVAESHGALVKEIEEWESLAKDVQDVWDVAKMDEADQGVNMVDELEAQTKKLEKKFEAMELTALMDGDHDKNNALLSIHAGTGGTDAMDWAGMLLRMYGRFAEQQNWKVEMLDESRGEEAGIKSATLLIKGRYSFGYLKAEHGVHRLVRISPFDAEGMRHTSFALVEVLPELEDVSEIEIDPKELKIDTYLSSGKGGQNVQKNETAVRITHEPTGVVVACQSERSQAQNKDRALKLLMAKLMKMKYNERKDEVEKLRGEYHEAAWGNQIRNYVLHPYHLVKDVRTNLETQDHDKVLDGDLMPFIEAYLREQKK